MFLEKGRREFNNKQENFTFLNTILFDTINQVRTSAGWMVYRLSIHRDGVEMINMNQTVFKLIDAFIKYSQIEYFDQNQWIELEASGLAFGYRKLQPITNAPALAEELYTYLIEREKGDLRRLDQVFGLFAGLKCNSQVLSEHFGQKLETVCGHCSTCSGQSIGKVPTASYPKVGDSARTAVDRLRKMHPDLLGDPRAQARFLCGLTSPKFTRARLSRDSSFGCCAGIPFATVVQGLS